MNFRPRVAANLKLMDADLFQPQWGGLRKLVEARALAQVAGR